MNVQQDKRAEMQANLIKKSLQIGLRTYAGKSDKAGREYILHPLRGMAKMKPDLERSAALLAPA